MSMKAECPACHAYLSGVYDAMEGERSGCPSCGLPGSAIRDVAEAQKSLADEKLKKGARRCHSARREGRGRARDAPRPR